MGFVEAIQALTASGGGDCPELTFEGMLHALYNTPLPKSPMYVFTDADAKDATEDRIQAMEKLTEGYQTTVNFFTTG